MPGPKIKSEKIGALFIFGVLAFSPPLLDVFDGGAETMVAGIPLLYFYLFLAWGAFVLLMLLIISAPDGSGGDHPATDD
ncbi:MAG: hypothetical protein V3R66_02470 [Rhodospirillales bacterium]